GPHETEPGHEHDREDDRRQQRAEVVEGEDSRDQVAKFQLLLEDSHEQRNLQPDEHANSEDDQIEEDREESKPPERRKEKRRREPAQERDGELGLDEPPRDILLQKPREPGTRSESREIQADDEGKLRHRIAQNVARDGSREELVRQAAGRDE